MPLRRNGLSSPNNALKGFECTRNLIPHFSVDRQLFFFAAGSFRGVWKAPVQTVNCTGENRTTFVSLVANGYDIIKRLLQIFGQYFGVLPGNIYADFAHSFN